MSKKAASSATPTPSLVQGFVIRSMGRRAGSVRLARRRRRLFPGEIKKMNARSQVREILIRKKMQRWLLISKYPQVYPIPHMASAEKLSSSLRRRYPEIMQRLGLTEWSAF
jgi:hypothetical protein